MEDEVSASSWMISVLLISEDSLEVSSVGKASGSERGLELLSGVSAIALLYMWSFSCPLGASSPTLILSLL